MAFSELIICVDRDGNRYEVPRSSLRPRISAYAIIIQNGKILLSPQWDGYDLPGGGIASEESLEQGLIREVKEETGFDIHVDNLISLQTNFFKLPSRDNDFVQSFMNFYTAHIVGGEFSIEGFDKDEKKNARIAEWICCDTLDDLKFNCSIDILSIIKKVISDL